MNEGEMNMCVVCLGDQKTDQMLWVHKECWESLMRKAEPSRKCPKCNGRDITTRWHKDDYDCKRFRELIREERRSDEHLHYYCRICLYAWTGDIYDKAK